MGESVLRRSLSVPSECSHDVKEGDPLRCLGESISFGRYMTEPLAWEKWSAFSHNRYLEEAEKFSKPGSVAQKKAYFEAHYKRKAAEKAAALLEGTNADARSFSELVTLNGNCDSSSMDLVAENVESHMVVAKEQENVFRNSEEVVYLTDVNGQNPNVEGNQLDVAKVDGVEEVIQESLDLENPIQVGISNQFEDVKEQTEIDATKEEKMPSKEAAGEENLPSVSKKRLINSSPRLYTNGGASRVAPSPAKRATHVQTINGKYTTLQGKRFATDLVHEKRLTEKSLHVSIHFTSHAGDSETRKITSPVVKTTRNPRSNVTKHNLSINNSASLRTTTSASVNGILKQSSVDLWSKDRRARTLLNKSVTGVITDAVRRSPSIDESSTTNRGKPGPPIVSCPFSLKSEERAEKRKEFYRRLEEKKKAKEAESKQLQLRSNKEKPVRDASKLRQSTGLKANLSQDVPSGLQLPRNRSNKIHPAQPWSPKLGRQSTLIKVPDSCSRSSVNSHSSKYTTQKYNTCTKKDVRRSPQKPQSMPPSLSKKNAHENLPPNIQS